ncbi:uncharacterized protein LOC125315390 isoform X1 [Rhodamnia argentea]|uniref:Uncharacterized protein LOC125315390 isoform X1 n=1 Tax=Rhodamnia argentea TaxID=178133 RepID=A0ABM3HHH8_9MYRT|nr:uncharacterized protein LOC125315390 isoform X1 [Rhodamnia argentea]
MNAVPFTSPNHMDENGRGSDTDSNPDESPEYYQPISAADDSDSGSDSPVDFPQRLPNGYCVENGVSSLSVNDGFELTSSDDDGDDEGEEEEERAREAYDAAMSRAFREDETRRNAPLTPHDGTRVMEAMRGVSFGGLAPDWAQSVPEDQWIERLRRLRQPPNTPN